MLRDPKSDDIIERFTNNKVAWKKNASNEVVNFPSSGSSYLEKG